MTWVGRVGTARPKVRPHLGPHLVAADYVARPGEWSGTLRTPSRAVRDG
jgi:hypothetical protein